MTTLVSLTGVSRTYRTRAEDIVAVANVTLDLEPGTLTTLVGPSGSGKSTLLNLVIGWEDPDAGHVRRDERTASGWAGMGVVPQGLGLLPELTIGENIALPVTLGNLPALTVDELLQVLGLTELRHQLPDAVSLGEQQRAAVARALITRPRLIVADEPTAHQDEANTLRVAGLLREAAGAGSAVLVATHDPRVLGETDRVVAILDGRLTPA